MKFVAFAYLLTQVPECSDNLGLLQFLLHVILRERGENI